MRGLLGLTEQDYDTLLRQSKSPTTDLVPHEEEFQHKETEEIAVVGESGGALAPRGAVLTAAAVTASEGEMTELIGRLTERQKQALKVFLLSML